MNKCTSEHRRARYLSIAGAFVLLSIVFVLRVLSPSPSPPEPVKERTETEPRRIQRTPPPVLDSETYYRTIIDNNLFRPLGWTRQHPKPIYRLSGTVVPTDGNKPRYAIVQTTTKNKTHIVTIGEKLDTNITVTDIQPRMVILDKAGQQITLKLEISRWLNTKGSRARRR